MIRRYWTWALAWIVGAIIVRALLSTLVPLLPDETYYWDWSRHLQGGYFDHPSGIAFLIRLGTAIAGDTHAGVRLGPALAAIATHGSAVLAAWFLGGRGLDGAVAAMRAAALVALVPVATLGLVLATPDALLFAAVMTGLIGVERALASPISSRPSTGWWCFVGVSLGVAFVAKYTTVLLPFGLVVACLVHPGLRARFREPGPWIASLIAMGIFAPVLFWNASNDWISFRFQFGHGFTGSARGNPVNRELELIGAQMALASPILFVLMATAVWAALRSGWRARRYATAVDETVRRFAIAMISVVPLAFFAVSAWRRAVEANWPALAYPGAMVLLATSTAPWSRRKWWRWGLGFAAFLLLVVGLQAWRPLLPLAPAKDPIARAHGWKLMANAMSAERSNLAQDQGQGRNVWVAADRYQDASELAFHMAGQPPVFSLNLAGRANQYDLWPGLADRAVSGDAMIVVLDDSPVGDSVAESAGEWFAEIRRGPAVELKRGDGVIARRVIWMYRGYRGYRGKKP